MIQILDVIAIPWLFFWFFFGFFFGAVYAVNLANEEDWPTHMAVAAGVLVLLFFPLIVAVGAPYCVFRFVRLLGYGFRDIYRLRFPKKERPAKLPKAKVHNG